MDRALEAYRKLRLRLRARRSSALAAYMDQMQQGGHINSVINRRSDAGACGAARATGAFELAQRITQRANLSMIQPSASPLDREAVVSTR